MRMETLWRPFSATPQATSAQRSVGHHALCLARALLLCTYDTAASVAVTVAPLAPPLHSAFVGLSVSSAT
jgi:hypothetical protein